METVIKKLTEIEIAAKRIMEDANNQLQKLSEQMQQKTDDFDAETARLTEQALAQKREELKAQTDASLAQLKIDADCISASLNNYYTENHDKISDAIYKKIIGM